MSTLKIGYVSDLHGTEVNPRARLDSYKHAFLDKLSQILNDYDLDVVFQAGDVFQKEQHEEDLKNTMISLLSKSKAKFICCPGNHDIFEDNLTTIPSTALGNLVLAKAIELIPDAGSLVFKDVTFNSLPYDFSKVESYLQSLTIKYKGMKKDILLVGHHFYEFGKCLDVSITKEMLESLDFGDNRVFMLLGHEHEQHEVVIINNIHIFRPGCVMRRTIDSFNMTQKPKLYVLEYDTKISRVANIEEKILRHSVATDVLDFERSGIIKSNTKRIVNLQKRLDESLNTTNESSSIKQDFYDACFPDEMEDFNYLENLHIANGVDF